MTKFYTLVADENRGKYMMFSSEVSEVKALRKHLKNMDNISTNQNPREKRRALRQNLDKKTDNIIDQTKNIGCKKPKEMHIYLPSIQ